LLKAAMQEVRPCACVHMQADVELTHAADRSASTRTASTGSSLTGSRARWTRPSSLTGL
jgi:hypothetical protein